MSLKHLVPIWKKKLLLTSEVYDNTLIIVNYLEVNIWGLCLRLLLGNIEARFAAAGVKNFSSDCFKYNIFSYFCNFFQN